jgi:hypothetical protein
LVSGYEWFNGPWHDVEWLIDTTRAYYGEHVTPKGWGDMFTLAQDRILEHRNWAASRVIIEPHFDAVVRDLNVFYLPKQVDPGPGIVFPQRDIYGRFTYGKFRPFYPLELKAGPAKYAFLGKKRSPMLFGNTDQTLVNIGRSRFAILVEGFFDLLACRLLVPDLPVLSTGTKSVNDEHIAYLQMLGVERVYLMFDNEVSSKDDEGAGNKAMRIISNTYSKKTDIEFRPLLCPNDDASLCLESTRGGWLLRDMLQKITV